MDGQVLCIYYLSFVQIGRVPLRKEVFERGEILPRTHRYNYDELGSEVGVDRPGPHSYTGFNPISLLKRTLKSKR